MTDVGNRIASKVSLELLQGLPEVLRLPLYDTLRGLARALNETTDAVEAVTESAGAPAPFPRVKACVNALGDPFPIDAETHLSGTCFDDVGAAAGTEIELPSVADLEAAGYDLETEIPHFRFQNTSGQIQRIRAGAGETMKVDGVAATSAGGYVDNESSGGHMHFGLFDDQWRCLAFQGECTVSA